MSNWRKLAALYLLVQSLCALLGWVLMFVKPEWRGYLFPDARPELVWAFLTADIPLFIGCGLAAAVALERGRAYAWPLLLLHTGAVLYASLMTVGLCVSTAKAWLALALMTPPMLITPYLAWRLRP